MKFSDLYACLRLHQIPYHLYSDPFVNISPQADPGGQATHVAVVS